MSTLPIYAVTVGVALRRPPRIHAYRRYVVAARSPLAASLLATQWAAARSVMPVYASTPELRSPMPDPEDRALDWLVEWALAQDPDARHHYFHINDDVAVGCGCRYDGEGAG